MFTKKSNIYFYFVIMNRVDLPGGLIIVRIGYLLRKNEIMELNSVEPFGRKRSRLDRPQAVQPGFGSRPKL